MVQSWGDTLLLEAQSQLQEEKGLADAANTDGKNVLTSEWIDLNFGYNSKPAEYLGVCKIGQGDTGFSA